MFNDISLFDEDIQLDSSLLKMDSNKKYNFVLNIYRKSNNYCEAFKEGARHILFFAKTFENLKMYAFKSMVHKYRGLFKYLPVRTDVDKKYMLLLYVELLKITTSFTKSEFFNEIIKKDELNDFWPFFVYFGRLFAAERDYANLKMVIENAKLGLKEKFKDIRQLVELEDAIPIHLKYTIVDHESESGLHKFMFREYLEASYEEVFVSKLNNTDSDEKERSNLQKTNTNDSVPVEDDDSPLQLDDTHNSSNVEEDILDSQSKNEGKFTLQNENNTKNNMGGDGDEQEVDKDSFEEYSSLSTINQIKVKFDKCLKDICSEDINFETCNLSQFEDLPPLHLDFFSQLPLEGTIPTPQLFPSPQKPNLKRPGEDGGFEDCQIEEVNVNSFQCTQSVFAELVSDRSEQSPDSDINYVPLKKKANLMNEKEHSDNGLEPELDSIRNEIKEKYGLNNDYGESVFTDEQHNKESGNSSDSLIVNDMEKSTEKFNDSTDPVFGKNVHLERSHSKDRSKSSEYVGLRGELEEAKKTSIKPVDISIDRFVGNQQNCYDDLSDGNLSIINHEEYIKDVTEIGSLPDTMDKSRISSVDGDIIVDGDMRNNGDSNHSFEFEDSSAIQEINSKQGD